MRKSSTAIFRCNDEVYLIKRQDYLKTFPGYSAFPGGKVDEKDSQTKSRLKLENVSDDVMNSLIRECREEVGVDIVKELNSDSIEKIQLVAKAITPSFNPYRFETFFFLIDCRKKINFSLDPNEFSQGRWIALEKIIEEYENQKILVVPPTINAVKNLLKKKEFDSVWSLDIRFFEKSEVPMIEPIFGIKQFLPLSNTLPPANRTNCFLIGNTLIDPSPKNEDEYKKLVYSLKNYDIEDIFLTHHHSDHHQFSPVIAKKEKIPMKMSKETLKRINQKQGKNYFKDIEIITLKEGDKLTKSEGKDVIILEVPGHDEGQLALACENMDWMIVGDLIQGIGTVVINEDEGDMRQYFQSLKKVISLNPKVIFPSHGIALGGVHYIKKTLEHREMREKQVKKSLQKGLTVDQMFEYIYSDLSEEMKFLAIQNIKAHIKKIEIES